MLRLPCGTSLTTLSRRPKLEEAVRLVKPAGGVLVLDNVNRYEYFWAIQETVPEDWLRHSANLLKDPVSNKVGKDRAGAQIEIANHRIAALQDYVVSQRAELEVLHSQLTSTNTTAFDYIDEQDAMVAFLKRELDQATKEKNDSVNENFRLTLEVKSKKESIATLKKQAAGLERQLMAAKKSSNAMSKQDLIEVDNAKSENAIRVNQDKE